MPSYSGFVLADDPINILIWVWGSNRTPRPRFVKEINSYLPRSADRKTTESTQMLYVPATVYPGPFFMKLSDLVARTGKNSSEEDNAKTALQQASQTWKSNFDAWREDGSAFTVQHDKVNPTPGSSDSYKTDEELSSMWSLIARRIKDAPSRQFNVSSRFWDPPLQGDAYRVYLVPTSAMTVDQVQTAVDSVLATSSSYSERYTVTVSASPPDLAGMHKVGHNFLCLYDTYMTDSEYKRMVKATYGEVSSTSSSDPWPIRPWPSFNTASEANNKLDGTKTPKPRKPRSTAKVDSKTMIRRIHRSRIVRSKRVMNNVAANTFGKLFWPNASTTRKVMPPYNAEWLHRTGWVFGGSQRRNSLLFGTSECGTQIMRAENSVQQFALASRWDCKLVTTPSDSAQPAGTRWMWQFDSDKSKHSQAPEFVRPTSSGKPFSWAIAFLDYEFFAEDKDTKQTIHVLDRFDTFNRYIPLRLEVELDKKVLDTYLSSLVKSKRRNKYQRSLARSEAQPWMSSLPLMDGLYVGGLDEDNLDSDERESSPTSEISLIHVNDPQIKTIVAQALAQPSGVSSSSLTYERTTKTLFGSTISADIYKYTGDLPSGVSPPPNNATPVYEQVKLESFSISNVFPDLAGTLFDALTLKNVLFVYQNCLIDSTKGVGWSIDCDVTIGANVGDLHDVIKNVLETKDDKTVHLSANLGHNPSQTWDTVLTTLSFTLTGSLNIPAIQFGSAIKLTSFGVHLHAFRCHDDASIPAKLKYTWDLFGSMSITMPGSWNALTFDYLLSENKGIVIVSGKLQGDLWKNAAGISGLELRGVSVSMNFGSGKKPTSPDVEITAEFSLDASIIEIDGTLASAALNFSATWPSFYLADLDFLHNLLHKVHLNLPDIDVAIGSAVISISASRPSLSFLDVTVDGRFDLPRVSIDMTSLTSVRLQGSFEGVLDIISSVTLNSASVIVSLGRVGKAASYLFFEAQITWNIFSSNLLFNVRAYLYKNHYGARQYIVYGAISGGQSWTFRNLLGDSCPGFLKGVGLKYISLLLASEDQDQKSVGPINTAYVIRKGWQVCAEIGTISQVNDVFNDCAAGTPTGLVLYVNLSDRSLTIQLPSAVSLDFGHGLKTSEITITIDTTPALIFRGGIEYRPNGYGTTLKFALVLTIQLELASANLSCTMEWNNPLGISTRLTIRHIQLGVRIVYALAHPNSIELGGRFDIGHSTHDVFLIFGDYPADYLLKVEVHHIDINEIIRFTAQLLHFSLPTIHNGTIYLEHFQLYGCLAQVHSGGKRYPPGFSASLRLKIFHVHASAHLEVSTGSGLSGSASVENFSFAFVHVAHAHLSVAWNRNDRHISVDGKFKFAWWWVHIHISIGPKGISFHKGYRRLGRHEASALSTHTSEASPEMVIEAVIYFPVFGGHQIPVVMRKNVPPTDWQDPMAGGPGIHYIFEAEFDANLLSTVTDRVKRHFEVHRIGAHEVARVVYSDILYTLAGGRTRQSEDEIARQCEAASAAAERARAVRCEELEAEFVQWRDRLDALVKRQATASEGYHALIRSLENHRATLIHQIAELPARTDRLRIAAEEALEQDSSEWLLHEQILRGTVGDLQAGLNVAIESITAITAEIQIVETALQRLDTVQLPWTEAMRQRLESTRATLRDKLSDTESARDLITRSQRDVAESAEPIYYNVRIAKAKVAEAETKLAAIVSNSDGARIALSAALAEVEERLRVEQNNGPSFRAFTDAQLTVVDHASSISRFITEDGRLENLDELPESVAWESARNNVSLSVDTVTGRESLEQTEQYWQSVGPEERRRAAFIADSALRQILQIHTIELDGILESGKTLEDLVLAANVKGKLGQHEFNHLVEFRLHKSNEFVHDLAKQILRGML